MMVVVVVAVMVMFVLLVLVVFAFFFSVGQAMLLLQRCVYKVVRSQLKVIFIRSNAHPLPLVGTSPARIDTLIA